MAEEQPSLHIDTDWKKQAQEEKRKLAEEEQKRAKESAARTTPSASGMSAGGMAGPGMSGGGMAASDAGMASPSAGGSRAAAVGGRERATPEASFSTLISSLATQVFFYLGDLSPRGTEPQVNLDLAKFNVDLLGVLEEKTRGNLSPDEQKSLDNVLYETRMRFVSVSSAYATV